MVQSLKSQLMERTILEEQRRFVEHYLHLSSLVKDGYFPKENSGLSGKIIDICVGILRDLVPGQIDEVAYASCSHTIRTDRGFTPLKAQALIEERLFKSPEIRGLLDYVSCSRIAYVIGEAYMHHLQRKIYPRSRLPQNISQ